MMMMMMMMMIWPEAQLFIIFVVTAYLMRSRKWRLETALNYVLGCHRHARPNRGFLQQLLNLENDVFGAEPEEEDTSDADI